MSPVAAISVTRYNGQTPRDATMRPLQTCRKRRTITVYCNSQNSPPGRGGALPRPRPNGNCDITGKRHGGVGSPRPTLHCLKICPHCGHTLSKLLTLNSPLSTPSPIIPSIKQKCAASRAAHRIYAFYPIISRLFPTFPPAARLRRKVPRAHR